MLLLALKERAVSYTHLDVYKRQHKRLVNTLKKGDPMPIDLTGQLIYYAGPCPAKPGHPIGSVGPTKMCIRDRYCTK